MDEVCGQIRGFKENVNELRAFSQDKKERTLKILADIIMREGLEIFALTGLPLNIPNDGNND